MKKTFLAITALAAMLFAGCTSSDELTTLESIKTADNTPTPVQFGTYMGKAGATRITIGKTGDMTTTTLQAAEGSGGGFGVFGYYTKNTDYTYNQSAFKPNFMYNQGVFYNSTKWEYSPVKYWPNGLNDQASAVGGDDATLTAGGKVSFFAYAPYVATATISGSSGTDDGIVGVSANTLQGNPTITYKMPSTNMVDLLWGTANSSGLALDGSTQAGSTLSDNTTTNGAATPVHYSVNADITKQQIDGAVRFNFIHALAKVGGSANDGVAGGLQIMLDIDALSGGTAEDANTKVTVKSIKISTDLNDDGDYDDTDEKISTKGTLDLATGLWTISAAPGDQAGFTQIIDRAGTSPASALNTDIAEPASWDATWANNTVNGVKIAPKNVYAAGSQENSPLLFFPGQTPKLRFTINYIVRTQDTKLDGGYSYVEQTVAKVVTFGAPVIINKKYNIIIHLGLTSVKFDATVASWSADIDDDGDVDSSDQTIVNLPLNVE